MVVEMVKCLIGVLIKIVFCIGTTETSTQLTGNKSCGQLVALKNNIVEGEYMSLQFTTYPGQNITWQKEIASHYIDVKRSEVYNMRSFDENTVHMLYFWGTSSRNVNSGNYRVKCFETFSSPVYVNIGKAPPVEKIYTPSKPEDETSQLETSTHMEDTAGIKCDTEESHKKGVSIGVGIGISVGVFVILIVGTLFLVISKIKKRRNSQTKTQTESHPCGGIQVAKTSNESSIANSGYVSYVSLQSTTRSNNEREYVVLMSSRPHLDDDNQQLDSSQKLN